MARRRACFVAGLVAVIFLGLTACSFSYNDLQPVQPFCDSLPQYFSDPVPPPERQFYVEQSAAAASDANPGTMALPWRTIRHAASVARPGDEVRIGPGVYYEQIRLSASGEPGRPIVFKASGAAVIDGTYAQADKLVDWGDPGKNYIVLDGLEVRNGAGWGVWIEGHHNLIRNCLVHDHGRDPAWPRASGIMVKQGDCNRLVGNTVFRNRWNGISVENANHTEIARNTVYGNIEHMGINVISNTSQFYGLMAGNDIHHNIVYGNGESGIYTRYQRCNEISNNLVYGNGTWGIFLHRGGTGGLDRYVAHTAIYNNTVSGNGADGIAVSGALGVTIVNNILSRNNTSGTQKAELRIEPLQDDLIDYNLYDPGLGAVAFVLLEDPPDFGVVTLEELRTLEGGRYEQNGRQGDPAFVNAEAGNFRLAPSSPALDSGIVAAGRCADEDLDGAVRPQGPAYDLGAFEYLP